MYKGFPEVVYLLRKYIKDMATNIIARDHPWGRICQLIGMLDVDSFDQAIIQSLEYTIDSFEKHVGPINPSKIGLQLRLINSLHALTNLPEEERLIRNLLAQCEEAGQCLGTATLPASMIILELGENLNAQGRNAEAEELVLKVLRQCNGAQSYGVKMEALQKIARIQFFQHKTVLAEKNLREAIKMVADILGIRHPHAIASMIELEGWLREWGREEEADKVKYERDELIERDEIDEWNDVE
jgi:hypothetical protein